MQLCKSYCEHGARCRLARGHTVKHRSAASDDYDPTACEWTDEESISREQADALLIMRGGLEGLRIAVQMRIGEMLAEAFPLVPMLICPDCGMVSTSQDDIENWYCGNCHEFKGGKA